MSPPRLSDRREWRRARPRVRTGSPRVSCTRCVTLRVMRDPSITEVSPSTPPLTLRSRRLILRAPGRAGTSSVCTKRSGVCRREGRGRGSLVGSVGPSESEVVGTPVEDVMDVIGRTLLVVRETSGSPVHYYRQ